MTWASDMAVPSDRRTTSPPNRCQPLCLNPRGRLDHRWLGAENGSGFVVVRCPRTSSDASLFPTSARLRASSDSRYVRGSGGGLPALDHNPSSPPLSLWEREPTQSHLAVRHKPGADRRRQQTWICSFGLIVGGAHILRDRPLCQPLCAPKTLDKRSSGSSRAVARAFMPPIPQQRRELDQANASTSASERTPDAYTAAVQFRRVQDRRVARFSRIGRRQPAWKSTISSTCSFLGRGFGTHRVRDQDAQGVSRAARGYAGAARPSTNYGMFESSQTLGVDVSKSRVVNTATRRELSFPGPRRLLARRSADAGRYGSRLHGCCWRRTRQPHLDTGIEQTWRRSPAASVSLISRCRPCRLGRPEPLAGRQLYATYKAGG